MQPLLAGLAAILFSSALRADLSFQSGPAQVALIELFTSEGCSSCPPAEKWLGDLQRAPGLWRDFVPVAFHVNYWDHLGWRDLLASKAFTVREHAYAAAWHSASVYTPCFVRNGVEWRPRETGLAAANGEANAGTLNIAWRPDAQSAQVEFIPATNAKLGAFEVNVALLGSDIISDVRRGENAGHKLHHEFVALRFETAPLKRNETGAWSATVALAAHTDVTAPRRALAAWITRTGQLTPVQAAGGWLE